MTFTEEKQKQSSDRFVLARLAPGRFINDDMSTTVPGIYTVSLEDLGNVSKIERNGTTLTRVDTFTGDDQYIVADDEKSVSIKTASAPNENSNIFILFHYIYLTTERGRYFPEDPVVTESASNPLRFWEPRISRSPSIEESYRNIVNAVMTIKASQLSVINTGSFLNPYLTKRDSFKNKTIEIYVGINDSLEKIFTGPMNDISIRENTASIRFRDAFSKINDLATYGGDDEDVYLRRSEFPLIDPDDEDKLKTFCLGGGTPARHKVFGEVKDTSSLFFPDKKVLDINACNKATNIDFSPTTTANRTHFCYRSNKSLATQTIGTFVRSISSSIGFLRSDTAHYYNFTGHNLKVGQTFEWDDGGGPYRGIVHHLGDFTDPEGGSLVYNVMVIPNANSDPVMSSGSEFTANESLVVALSSDTDKNFTGQYLIKDLQYTITQSISPLPTGTTLRIVLDAAVTYDGEDDDIYYQAEFETFSDVLGGTGDTVKTLLDAIDIPTNASSFSSLDSSLYMEVRMQVPEFGTTQLPTYRRVLENIMGSSLTYLSQNEDGEAVIGLLEAPVSGEQRDRNLVISGSQSVSYGYNDIFQTIVFMNKHQNTQDPQAISTISTNNLSTYLHGESRTKDFEHVLNDISVRIDAHKEIFGNRQAEYSCTVATEDIDTELGEDVTIESDKITTDGTENVKITSIKRSSDRVQVKATDLGDLT